MPSAPVAPCQGNDEPETLFDRGADLAGVVPDPSRSELAVLTSSHRPVMATSAVLIAESRLTHGGRGAGADRYRAASTTENLCCFSTHYATLANFTALAS